MNFLAHIYLSGEDEGIIIGNFIADGIKGKRYLKSCYTGLLTVIPIATQQYDKALQGFIKNTGITAG